MWKAFLSGWNGRSFFSDSTVFTSPDLELYTDAASSVGFGGYFNGQWFQVHVLFCSTVFFIGLPCDSTRTIKGLVKVLCLILSCIAKLVTSTILKFCNAHPSLPLEALLLFLINMGSPFLSPLV